MAITLDPELEAAVSEMTRREGVTPDALALRVLRERFLAAALQPRGEWERRLLETARDWGVALPDAALSREELYD